MAGDRINRIDIGPDDIAVGGSVLPRVGRANLGMIDAMARQATVSGLLGTYTASQYGNSRAESRWLANPNTRMYIGRFDGPDQLKVLRESYWAKKSGTTSISQLPKNFRENSRITAYAPDLELYQGRTQATGTGHLVSNGFSRPVAGRGEITHAKVLIAEGRETTVAGYMTANTSNRSFNKQDNSYALFDSRRHPEQVSELRAIGQFLEGKGDRPHAGAGPGKMHHFELTGPGGDSPAVREIQTLRGLAKRGATDVYINSANFDGSDTAYTKAVGDLARSGVHVHLALNEREDVGEQGNNLKARANARNLVAQGKGNMDVRTIPVSENVTPAGRGGGKGYNHGNRVVARMGDGSAVLVHDGSARLKTDFIREGGNTDLVYHAEGADAAPFLAQTEAAFKGYPKAAGYAYADRKHSPYNELLVYYMPSNGKDGRGSRQVHYVIDPRVTVDAVGTAVEAIYQHKSADYARNLADFQKAPGMMTALYQAASEEFHPDQPRPGTIGGTPIPDRILELDAAMKAKTWGQSEYWPTMWSIGGHQLPAWAGGGPQLGNRGILDTWLLRMARTADIAVGQGARYGDGITGDDPAGQGPIAKLVDFGYANVSEVVYATAAFYAIGLPGMRLMAEGRHSLGEWVDTAAKNSGSQGWAAWSKRTLDLQDRSANRVAINAIDLGRRVTDHLDSLFQRWSGQSSVELMNDLRGYYDGSQSFARANLAMFKRVDAFWAKVPGLSWMSSESPLGKIFENVFNIKVAGQTAWRGTWGLLRGAIDDLRSPVTTDIRAELESLGVKHATDAERVAAQAHYLAGLDTDKFERLFGTRAKALAGVMTPGSADLTPAQMQTLNAEIARQMPAPGVTPMAGPSVDAMQAKIDESRDRFGLRKAAIEGVTKSRAHNFLAAWKHAGEPSLLGWNRYFGMTAKEGGILPGHWVGRAGLALGVALLGFNFISGELGNAGRAMSYQQFAGLDAINNLRVNEATYRATLNGQPGMPQTGNPVVNAAAYYADRGVMASILNGIEAYKGWKEGGPRYNTMGALGFGQIMAYKMAGDINAEHDLTQANDPWSVLAETMRYRGEVGLGANQNMLNSQTFQSVVLKVGFQMWSPISASFTRMNGEGTFALGLHAPVQIRAGISVTMPFGIGFDRDDQGVETWHFKFMQNSTLEGLTLATIGLGLTGQAMTDLWHGVGKVPGLSSWPALRGIAANENVTLAASAIRGTSAFVADVAGLVPYIARSMGTWGYDHLTTRTLLAKTGLVDQGALYRALHDTPHAVGRRQAVDVVIADELANLKGQTTPEAIARANALKGGARVTLSRLALTGSDFVLGKALPALGGVGVRRAGWMLAAATVFYSAWNPASLLHAVDKVGEFNSSLPVWGQQLAGGPKDGWRARAGGLLGAIASAPTSLLLDMFGIGRKTHPNETADSLYDSKPMGNVSARTGGHNGDWWNNLINATGIGHLLGADGAFHFKADQAYWQLMFEGQTRNRVVTNGNGDRYEWNGEYTSIKFPFFTVNAASGSTAPKQNADREAWVNTMNLQLGTNNPLRVAATTYRQTHLKAMTTGVMFHEEAGLNTLGWSGQLELARRRDMAGWVLNNHNPMETGQYFFFDRQRGKIDVEKYLPSYFHAAADNLGGLSAGWTGFFSYRRARLLTDPMFKIFQGRMDWGRQSAANGGSNEIESGDDYTEDFNGGFNAPRGKSVYQLEDDFWTRAGIAVGGGLSAIFALGGLGVMAAAANSRRVVAGKGAADFVNGRSGGEGFWRKTQKLHGAESAGFYMETHGVDPMGDGTLVIRGAGGPVRGQSMETNPGHRFYFTSFGREDYRVFGGMPVAMIDPLYRLHTKGNDGAMAAAEGMRTLLPNEINDRNIAFHASRSSYVGNLNVGERSVEEVLLLFEHRGQHLDELKSAVRAAIQDTRQKARDVRQVRARLSEAGVAGTGGSAHPQQTEAAKLLAQTYDSRLGFLSEEVDKGWFSKGTDLSQNREAYRVLESSLRTALVEVQTANPALTEATDIREAVESYFQTGTRMDELGQRLEAATGRESAAWLNNGATKSFSVLAESVIQSSANIVNQGIITGKIDGVSTGAAGENMHFFTRMGHQVASGFSVFKMLASPAVIGDNWLDGLKAIGSAWVSDTWKANNASGRARWSAATLANESTDILHGLLEGPQTVSQVRATLETAYLNALQGSAAEAQLPYQQAIDAVGKDVHVIGLLTEDQHALLNAGLNARMKAKAQAGFWEKGWFSTRAAFGGVFGPLLGKLAGGVVGFGMGAMAVSQTMVAGSGMTLLSDVANDHNSDDERYEAAQGFTSTRRNAVHGLYTNIGFTAGNYAGSGFSSVLRAKYMPAPGDVSVGIRETMRVRAGGASNKLGQMFRSGGILTGLAAFSGLAVTTILHQGGMGWKGAVSVGGTWAVNLASVGTLVSGVGAGVAASSAASAEGAGAVTAGAIGLGAFGIGIGVGIAAGAVMAYASDKLGINNAVARWLDGSPEEIAEGAKKSWSNRFLMWELASIGNGAQWVLDSTLGNLARLDQGPNAGAAAWAVAGFARALYSWFPAKDPTGVVGSYRNLETPVATSASAMPELWHLPWGGGQAAAAMSLSPLWHGNYQDAVNARVNIQEEMRKGGVNAFMQDWYGPGLLGQDSGPAGASVITGATDHRASFMGSSFGQLSTPGESTLTGMRVRALASQFTLSQALDRRKVWGNWGKNATVVASGYRGDEYTGHPVAPRPSTAFSFAGILGFVRRNSYVIGGRPSDAGGGVGAGAPEPELGGGGPVAGWRRASAHNFHEANHFGHTHQGTDIAVAIGTQVRASVNGVIRQGTGMFGGKTGFGNVIYMHGDDGADIVLGHLSGINVKTGQRVVAGQVIGATGNSGHSTGPHLHFEVRRNGVAVDPEAYIERLEQNGASNRFTRALYKGAQWMSHQIQGKRTGAVMDDEFQHVYQQSLAQARALPGAQKAAIDPVWMAGALALQRTHGIPALVTLTQGTIESSRGTDGKLRHQNNFFGLNALPGQAHTPDRKYDWAAFGSVSAGFNGYGRFLQQKHYEPAFAAASPEAFVTKVYQGGYDENKAHLQNALQIMHTLQAQLTPEQRRLIAATPGPTATPTARPALVRPSETPHALATPSPSPTATATPHPVNTPTPRPTMMPTAQPLGTPTPMAIPRHPLPSSTPRPQHSPIPVTWTPASPSATSAALAPTATPTPMAIPRHPLAPATPHPAPRVTPVPGHVYGSAPADFWDAPHRQSQLKPASTNGEVTAGGSWGLVPPSASVRAQTQDGRPMGYGDAWTDRSINVALAAKMPSPNSDPRTGGVDMIVIHSTESGRVTTARDIASVFASPKFEASAHYVIGRDGAIVQAVSEDRIAWHAGDGDPKAKGWRRHSSFEGAGGVNARSIGIEFVNTKGQGDYSASQIEAGAQLVAAQINQYHVPMEHIVGHGNVNPYDRSDPTGFPWAKFRERVLANLAGAVVAGAAAAAAMQVQAANAGGLQRVTVMIAPDRAVPEGTDAHTPVTEGRTDAQVQVDADRQKILASATYPDGTPWVSLADTNFSSVEHSLIDPVMAWAMKGF